MRDEEKRRIVLDQDFLEPLDRIDVEMVRGLVEEQHVGFAHERPREQDLSLRSAGRSRERCLGVEAQVNDDRVDARVDLPSVRRVERVVQAVEIAQRRRRRIRADAMAGLMVACEQKPDLAEPRGDDIEGRAVDVAGNFLLESRNGNAGLTNNLAAVGCYRAVE